MKGQLNVNTLWLGMDLSMAIHIMSQRQNYVIVNFHLEFRWGIYETHMSPEDPSNRKKLTFFVNAKFSDIARRFQICKS